MEKGVQILDWPATSPDLNLIENLWGLLKQKINSVGAGNYQDLIIKANEIFLKDPEIRQTY